MHTLYTLGYQGSKIEHVAEYTRRLEAVLFDVRLSPRSRNPVWSKKRLTERFGDQYRHLGELGNINYRGDGPIQLRDEEAGMEELREALQDRPVILLCGCWDLEECHRKVIAEKAVDLFGVQVEHLEGKPASEQQEMELLRI
jgi:uncharacterized protein (DUF488 family)